MQPKHAIPQPEKSVRSFFLDIDNVEWYKITNYDHIPPFFMSITSADNFWLFISTTGGLTCGRKNNDNALFPYCTVDKVTESCTHTGSLSAFLARTEGKAQLWQPFSPMSSRMYEINRNIYKTVLGDRLMFEEENLSLGLTFKVRWETSPKYGFHRCCSLVNSSSSPQSLRLVDGIRNILPAGITAQIQNTLSNLLDAYKRSEADEQSALGIYALSASLSDQPEASESLRATTVWSYGLDELSLLLSEVQVATILENGDAKAEKDVRAERGAYLKTGAIHLGGNETRHWGMVAEVNQDHSTVIGLLNSLQKKKAATLQSLHADIDQASERLRDIIAMNDGIQDTGSRESTAHHVSNVLFNVMRGGYFIDGYTVSSGRFASFLQDWNRDIAEQHADWIRSLPEHLTIKELHARAGTQDSVGLERLTYEYLPLTFSRRHGDPSRPWNQFLIQTKDEEGEQIIGYQGNWRDIFQNWEALCFSYPLYYSSVIVKFLNACTADGYNPYKISHRGIDWETPNPDDPWSNIGYWSDHQIVYLSKLLEQRLHFFPEMSGEFLDKDMFVYANVPYRIRKFEELLLDPHNSIIFDSESDARLRKTELGADGKLLRGQDGAIATATMVEKLLVLFLAKLANYVPGGGIWMNTQRPEWNDANNALAGWGLSMVTLSYMTRFIDLLSTMLQSPGASQAPRVRREIAEWLRKSHEALRNSREHARGGAPAGGHAGTVGAGAVGAVVSDPRQRLSLLRKLGTAACEYRSALYTEGLGGAKEAISRATVLSFLEECSQHFLDSINYCRKDDGCFESYQVLVLKDGGAHIKKLCLMLEGQVAGLSLNSFPAGKTHTVIRSLGQGQLYREDQHSYLLYPDKDLPGFLEKNSVAGKQVREIAGNRDAKELFRDILQEDIHGGWHFNADFQNVQDVEDAAKNCSPTDRDRLKNLFEETFKHAEFTGRSGTFFAYEGLGSIYWHMISKLLLAVQERLIDCALSGGTPEDLKNLKTDYIDIRSGIGFNKSPEVYGAFPCDPYSHSPKGKGAKQPGMTGQVKEEVLTRFAELGLVVRRGEILFIPELILEDQWKTGKPSQGQPPREDSSPGQPSLEFAYCGIPFTVSKAEKQSIRCSTRSGEQQVSEELKIDSETARHIFERDNYIVSVHVQIPSA